GVLDLDAVHVLTTAVDHVLDPVDQVDQALVVDPGHVAGVQPAAGEGGGRRLRLVPVAGHHVRAADHELAGAVGTDRVQPDVAYRRREADRVGVVDGLVWQGRGHARGLGGGET